MRFAHIIRHGCWRSGHWHSWESVINIDTWLYVVFDQMFFSSVFSSPGWDAGACDRSSSYPTASFSETSSASMDWGSGQSVLLHQVVSSVLHDLHICIATLLFIVFSCLISLLISCSFALKSDALNKMKAVTELLQCIDRVGCTVTQWFFDLIPF